jgi:hypothetical protein
MVAPFVSSSSTVVSQRILGHRATNKRTYGLIQLVEDRGLLFHILTGVLVIGGILPVLPTVLAVAFVVLAILIQLTVWILVPFLKRWMRELEFRIVIEENQKFMKMFGLIGEGILTKDEFCSKAADVVGDEQVARFFERRALENAHRIGDLTNDEFIRRMSLIGYGPEETMEEWQFEIWLRSIGDI